MNTSISETVRRFRGSPADELAGALVFIAMLILPGIFFGPWGMVYTAIVCVIASIYVAGSLVLTALRTEKTEVRHV